MEKEIERLERELETPITIKRRHQIQDAINYLRRELRNWQAPH